MFHMSLLKQDIIRKGPMNKLVEWPEFEADNNKGYKVEVIQDNTVYAKKTDRHLPRLYHIVAWKGYPEEENTRKPSSTVIYLRKMVSTFYKDHSEKPIAISLPLDSALLMTKPIIQLSVQRKQGQLAKECRNNMTFGVKSSRSKSYVITTNYDLISSGLTSITMIGSSSSTPQSRWYVYL